MPQKTASSRLGRKAALLSPAKLFASVVNDFLLDADEFPEFVYSKFGQKIRVTDGPEKWAENLRVTHVGYQDYVVPWANRFSDIVLVEWAFRSWFIERLELRIDLRPATDVAASLKRVRQRSLFTHSLDVVLSKWAVDECRRASASGLASAIIGIRQFFQWGVEEGVPGFAEHTLDDLREISLPSHAAAKALVSLLDVVAGPHSSAELRQIEAALEAREGCHRERAIYFLCRDWGLRPIQLALLRESDYGTNELGPYIDVPSVNPLSKTKHAQFHALGLESSRFHLVSEVARSLGMGEKSLLSEGTYGKCLVQLPKIVGARVANWMDERFLLWDWNLYPPGVTVPVDVEIHGVFGYESLTTRKEL